MRLGTSCRVTLTALLVLALEAAGRAQPAPAPGSPEATLARAVDAVNHDRIEEFTGEMHPNALRSLRTTLVSLIDAADRAGKSGEMLRLFDGVKSPADLKTLDDRQFSARFLRGVTGLRPELKKALAGAKVEMLGSVAEGKDRAHVIYKLTIQPDGEPIENITVNSLQRLGSRWTLLLSSDMEGMVAMMKLQAAGKRVLPDMKASRIEPVGRIVRGDTTGPAYVVYRLITPLADSKISKIAVLTVDKSDPGWAVAQRGKPGELAGLIREKLGLEPSADKGPATDASPQPQSQKK